jgi:hypothetical protein
VLGIQRYLRRLHIVESKLTNCHLLAKNTLVNDYSSNKNLIIEVTSIYSLSFGQ